MVGLWNRGTRSDQLKVTQLPGLVHESNRTVSKTVTVGVSGEPVRESVRVVAYLAYRDGNATVCAPNHRSNILLQS